MRLVARNGMVTCHVIVIVAWLLLVASAAAAAGCWLWLARVLVHSCDLTWGLGALLLVIVN